MSTRRLRVLWMVAVAALCCACSTLPDSGVVHTQPDAAETGNPAPYFAPPGPSADDDPEEIVRGFLLAMQANPPSTSVARSFLSTRVKNTWNPNQGTIVYDAATVQTTDGQLTARLRGAHRLSPSGAWLDGTDASTTTLPITVVREKGGWRIDNPPDVLAVPASYFSSLFVPFNLYFFDHTGTVLVPTRVYVPGGEDTATNLVRGLLAGPPAAERTAAVSAFPPGLDLDELAVVVNDAGIADVPLGPEMLRLSPAGLNRAVVQLAWTLRQVPGINRLKLTVDGAPLPLTDGGTDMRVGEGAQYDPLMAASRDLLALSGGRVVREDGDPVGGPFGEAGFALRSLAWSPTSHQLAAVSATGRRVFEAPDRGARTPSRVDTVYDGGSDVLRPAYDRFGGLWIVDSTRSGAVVHLIRNGRDRTVRIAGVTGSEVSAFTVTRDGASFVAVLASGSNPTVLVSSLSRTPGGRLLRAAPARTLQVSGVDLGPARDVVQNGATSVAVLTRPESGADQIASVELDGSPGLPEATGAEAVPGTVPGSLAGLMASPDPALSLRVVTTDGHLYTFSDTGRWLPSRLSDVTAIAYAE